MSNPPTSAAALGAAVGRAVLALGLFLLGFAGYQLWGTGLAEAEAQDQLAEELSARLTATPDRSVQRPEPTWLGEEPGLADAESAGGEPDDAPLIVDPRPAAAPAPVPASVSVAEPIAVGAPFARLRLPTIDVDKTVVEGTTREALRSGPGHYLGTARPGQAGNVAIAGHRTTYGAPFHDIDRLAPGDPIVIETEDGVFTYRVEAQHVGDGEPIGHRIVAPEAVEVIADKGDHRLTLTACHPRYSARQRIVVTAVLDEPAQTPSGTVDPGPQPSPQPDIGSDAASTTGSELLAAGPAPSPASSSSSSSSSSVTVSVRVPLPDGPLDTAGARPPAPPVATAAPTKVSAPAEASAPAETLATIDLGDDLGWQPAHAPASLAWAALSGLVVAAAWLLGRLWRRTPAYLMAGPSLSLCLVTCFSHLDRLIPAT